MWLFQSKRILLAVALLVPAVVHAEDRWALVGSSATADTYIDVDTVRLSGTYIRYWIKREYQNDPSKRVQSRVLTEIDCSEGRIRYLQIAYYYADGTNDSSKGAATWEFIAPETIADGQRLFLCTPMK